MSADDSLEPSRPRGRRWATASVAAAVLLVGGGGAYWASTVPGGDSARAGAKAPPLVLSGYGEHRGGGAARGAAPDTAEHAGAWPVYEAAGPLPKGPDAALAYRPADTVGRGRAAALAEALGLPGGVREEGSVWRAGGGPADGAPVLSVGARTPGTWSYLAGRERAPEGEPVSPRRAEAAAGPVLDALGLRNAEVDAGRADGAVRTVSAAPRLAGLPTHGWETTLRIGPDGAPVGGDGRLAALEAAAGGVAYPVMSARKTLAALNERSPRTEPGPRAGGSGPLAVVDAVFGLSAYPSEEGRYLLVPSWLFEVRAPGASDGTHTVAHPAVEPEFLAPPRAAGPGAGDGAGGDAPDSAPAAPGGAPGGPVEGLPYVEEHSPGARSLTVHFWGGVCHDYSVTARETADAVRVRIAEERKEPGRACILVAKEMTARVALEAPVGDRRVLDEDGKPLPEGPAERGRRR